MTTKKIRKIAQNSFINGKLDKKVIAKVTRTFTRREFKTYVRALRIITKKRVVKVYVPNKRLVTREIKNSLLNFFQEKELDFIEEPEILAGIRIVDNDMIYELNLRDSLENMINYLRKSYD